MVIKVTDATGEAWLSVFNEQAEKIIGCSADELNQIKLEVINALNQISLLVYFAPTLCLWFGNPLPQALLVMRFTRTIFVPKRI